MLLLSSINLQSAVIIAGTEETLRLVLNQPEYHQLANSENFVSELGLADAIQALSEVHQAIERSECDLVSAVVSSQLPPSGISH